MVAAPAASAAASVSTAPTHDGPYWCDDGWGDSYHCDFGDWWYGDGGWGYGYYDGW
ncbi:hypothetical protein [Actinocorallia aurea]